MDPFPVIRAVPLLAVLASAPAVAALQVPIIGGKTGTIETLNRVVDGRASALLRWTDSLGNIRRTTVALRPVAAQAGALATRVLAGRLMVAASVGLLLAESMRGSLTALWPDVKITADGTAVRPGETLPWQACEPDLVRVADSTGTKRSAYAFLPCYTWASAPTRVALRLPPETNFSPDPAWLNQYGVATDSTRDAWYVPAATPTVAERGFREIIRPQPEKSLALPATEATLTDAQLTQAVMQPETLGALAQADAIPSSFWEPVAVTDLEADTSTTQPGEGESTLPPDVTMADVARTSIDVRSWYNPDSWGWLPRSCSLPGPYTPIQRYPQWTINFSQYQGDFCPAIGRYVAPASDLVAILIFVSIVMRVRTGGA